MNRTSLPKYPVDPCAVLWELADWLTVDQAAELWCCGDPLCMTARAAAIAGAIERGEIEARDSAKWCDAAAQLIARGQLERVQVNRVSLALWAESLPPETRAREPFIQTRSRMDDSHLRALFALAKKAGIDFADHGSAARLRKLTELEGVVINADAAERIANRIREKRGDWP